MMRAKAISADPNYRSDIPAGAAERIVKRHANGQAELIELWLHDRLVGRRFYDMDGSIDSETPLRDGRVHGTMYRWYLNDRLLSAEPVVDGVAHGTARQWAEDGSLLGTYTLDHGTGIDLWWSDCDSRRTLSEVWYMKDGCPHGWEWWLNVDQRSVWQERHWRDGRLDGIERQWNGRGRLARGYPRYWLKGQQVDKRKYIRATRHDPTLPPFREKDQHPQRRFPAEIRPHLGGRQQRR